MARLSKTIEEKNGTSRAAPRRTIGRAAWALLLIAVAASGCAAGDGVRPTNRIDLVVLTTDRETTDALLGRLHDVERLPPATGQAGLMVRGQLTRELDGRIYSILVAPREGRDESTFETFTRRTIETWRPRYLLAIGTSQAIANEGPLGAVGIVPLICDFDLARFESVRDLGNCYRSDGGLLAAALYSGQEWEVAEKEQASRVDCSPARVVKMGSLSGDPDSSPRFVEVVTSISEEIHRGLLMETEGASIARVIGDLRHEMREPMGFLMIRSISEVRTPAGNGAGDAGTADAERRQRQRTCAANDVADFAVELIRRRWPVSPGASP